MEGSLPQLALVALLVLINATLAGSELALVSLREGQLQKLHARGGSGEVLVRLARDPNRFLATIQIGITLAGLLASATAAVTLAHPLEEHLDLLGGAARPVSILLITVALSYVTLVFGELAPKRVAMQRAEAWGLVVARPLAVASAIARPVVWLLSRSTDLAVRLIGGDPAVRREGMSQEELRHLLATQSGVTAKQRTILSGAFEIAERTLGQVMRPRRSVVAIEAATPVEEAIQRLLSHGHTRAPVVQGGDLDRTIGVIHVRSLVGATGVAGDLVTEAVYLPESARVLTVLQEMQQARERMAIVVNEHGGVEGIVTIEDLLEEIVGEIYDETDREILSVEREPGGTILVAGSFPVHDLVDIGVEIEAGESVTLAGLILEALGRIPEQPGDTVTLGSWEATVLEVEDRAITRVRLRPSGTSTPPAASSTSS